MREGGRESAVQQPWRTVDSELVSGNGHPAASLVLTLLWGLLWDAMLAVPPSLYCSFLFLQESLLCGGAYCLRNT